MRVNFSYDHEFYTPDRILAAMSNKEEYSQLRKDYTKMRDIANKRLYRMGKSEFAKTQTYKKYKNKFKKLADIKTPQEFAYRLSELERFITRKTSTVSGQREIMNKSLQTLHENEYTFVNAENFFDFAEFMEEYRNQLLDMEYDSGQAADTFGALEKKKVPAEKMQELFNTYLSEKENAKSAMEIIMENISDFNNMRVTKKMAANPKELANTLETKVNKRKAKERKEKAKTIVQNLNRREQAKARKNKINGYKRKNIKRGKAPVELKPIEKRGGKK